MPSVSKKQARFMAAAAHNPLFAKKAGIKPAVAKEFNQADTRGGALKKALGGMVRRPIRAGMSNPRQSLQASPLSQIDQTMAGTGEALRGTISRIASGKGSRRPVGKAEGGKISVGLNALRVLAKKFEEALDMQDSDTAGMIARKMEQIQPGSSKEVMDSRASVADDQKARNLKLSTFAKGGKVKKKAMGGVVDEADDSEEEEAPAPAPKKKAKGPDPTAIGNRVIAFAKKEGCSVEDLLSRMESSYEDDETTGEDDEEE